MKCSVAQHMLALWVGDDLEAQDVAPLQRHLAECPQCRTHWRDLRHSVGMLRETRPQPDLAGLNGLWPGVRMQLAATRSQPAASWQGWYPVVALATACAAVLVMAFSTPAWDLQVVQDEPAMLVWPEATPRPVLIDSSEVIPLREDQVPTWLMSPEPFPRGRRPLGPAEWLTPVHDLHQRSF